MLNPNRSSISISPPSGERVDIAQWFKEAIALDPGFTETPYNVGVTRQKEAYIRLAVELARDPHLLADMRSQVVARKDRLYRDTEFIAALEAFYAAAVFGSCLDPHREQP